MKVPALSAHGIETGPKHVSLCIVHVRHVFVFFFSASVSLGGLRTVCCIHLYGKCNNRVVYSIKYQICYGHVCMKYFNRELLS